MTLFVRQPLPSTAAWFIYNYCPDFVYFPALVFMCIVEVTKYQQMLLLVQQMLLVVSESTAAILHSHTAATLQPYCSHNETLALPRLPVSAVVKVLLQVVLPPLVLAWGPGVLSQFLGCALIFLMLGIQLTGPIS